MCETREVVIWARTRPQNNGHANSSSIPLIVKKWAGIIVRTHALTTIRHAGLHGGVEKHRLASDNFGLCLQGYVLVFESSGLPSQGSAVSL